MLYRKSVCDGQLPLDWRSASITPIFKKGSRVSTGNYRPVRLTSVPCKVLESIIRDDMLSHLESHKLIAEEQHGFVKNKSCLTNLLETLDDVTSALDSGEGLDMVFLDYKKAFDSVPHQRLVHKLKSYGFGDRIIQWVANFLYERKQIVTVRGHSSKPVSVLSGVPQGSVLGPLYIVHFICERTTRISFFEDKDVCR